MSRSRHVDAELAVQLSNCSLDPFEHAAPHVRGPPGPRSGCAVAYPFMPNSVLGGT